MSSEFIARDFSSIDHKSAAHFIWSHIRRHPFVAVLMVLGALANASLASAVPVFTGRAVDAIINSSDLLVVRNMALLIIASQLSRGVLQLMRNFSAETFGQRIERDVRDEIYASLLGKDMTYHAFTPVGEIMARVTNDVRELNLMMNPGLNLIVGSGMFLLMPLIFAPSIHPQLVIVPAAFILVYIVVQYHYVTNVHAVAQEVRAAFGHMNSRLAETLDGIQVVKGTAQEDQEAETFADLATEVRDRFVQQGDIEARYLALLLLGLAVGAGFLHAMILYRAGSIAVGDIVAFMGQIFLFGFPAFTSLFALVRVASGYAGAQRILQVLTTQTELDQNLTGCDQEMEGAIVFDDVCFSYVDDKPIIRGVSFKIEPGQTVAIVGQTGAGKSTLTQLINRTYDVDSGRVLVDGVDVRDWTLESLRSQISIIEQEIFLFSRSIRDNIAFGRPAATQEEVEDAAHRAQAHDFISKLPDGYDTVIGQRGVTLSGGQRQRLAIARAFLTDPQVLILDDSTSAIDSATEDRIQRAIWEAAKGRTTILITHRLSQIRWADHIVVLRKGEVAAQGSHEELLQSSEAYRRIFDRYEAQTTFLSKERIQRLINQQQSSD